MKVYAVVESYQWYKGADTTLWGVCKTIEGAKKCLRDAIEELYEDFFLDKDDDEIEEFIESRFVETDGDIAHWFDEDDDAVRQMYISETELED